MSRRLTVILLVLLVLVGAMSLKTAVAAHDGGSFTIAVGGAPQPPPLPDVGGAPQPPPIMDYSAGASVVNR